MIRLIAAPAFLAAVAAAVTLAPAAPAANVTVIRLISITTYEKHVDVPPKADSAGDRDYSASKLINAKAQFGKPKGAVVGSDRSVMMLESPTSALLKTAASLPGGTILFGGRLMAAGNGAVKIPVVRGTGVYAGAKGTLTVLRPTGPKTVVNIYRLTYPLTA